MPAKFERAVKLLSNHQSQQIELIRKSFPADRPIIAFFCPTQSFCHQFGNLPQELRAAGHSVLKLYGEKVQNEFVRAPNAFHVWGDMITQMDFVDVFFAPTVMDCLPPRSKKILLSQIKPSSRNVRTTCYVKTYEDALKQYDYLHAFLPLFDYITVRTPDEFQHIEQVMHFYGRNSKLGERKESSDCKILLTGLNGQRLAQKQTIIPAGFTLLDSKKINSTDPSRVVHYLAKHIEVILSDSHAQGWEQFIGGPIKETVETDPQFAPEEISNALTRIMGITPTVTHKKIIEQFQSLIRVLGPHQLGLLLPVLASKINGSETVRPIDSKGSEIGIFLSLIKGLNGEEKQRVVRMAEENPIGLEDLIIALSWLPQSRWDVLASLAERYLINRIQFIK